MQQPWLRAAADAERFFPAAPMFLIASAIRSPLVLNDATV